MNIDELQKIECEKCVCYRDLSCFDGVSDEFGFCKAYSLNGNILVRK